MFQDASNFNQDITKNEIKTLSENTLQQYTRSYKSAIMFKDAYLMIKDRTGCNVTDVDDDTKANNFYTKEENCPV